MHQHFNPMPNASVMVAQVAMRVYMFHSRQFRVLVISPFFHPHKPFDDITLDDICPPFRPLRYPTDGKFDFDTCLTLTYFVEPNPSEPSYLSIIHLSSDSSTSSAAGRAPPLVCRRGFIHARAVPHRNGCARGGGRGDDAPSGFENRYLLFDG